MSLWIPARQLEISWGDDTSYWRWTSLPPDELEVAELLSVCWLAIGGKVELKKLLLKTSYSAYLVFKLNNGCYGLKQALARIGFVRSEQGKDLEVVEECSVFIDRKRIPGEGGRFPQPRGKGWMEIKLGEFFNNLGDDGIVEAALREVKEQNWKSGLIVRGIEIRPNY